MKKLSNKEEVDFSENPNYLRYSDDPALAIEAIEQALFYRQQTISDIRENLAKTYSSLDILTHTHDPYQGYDHTSSMGYYYLNKLVALLQNDWVSDTAVFDLHDWTGSLHNFLARIKENPERQFLIPVDFHH